MSKKTLLSAILISALSFSSTVFGAADVSEKGTELNGAAFRNCKFSQFPLDPSARDSLAAISFQDCTLETFDPTFLTYNTRLNKLCLARCTDELSFEEIIRFIRMFRTAQAAASRSSVDQSALTSSLGL